MSHRELFEIGQRPRSLLGTDRRDYGVQIPVVHGVPPSADDDVRQSSETTTGEAPVQVMVTVLAV